MIGLDVDEEDNDEQDFRKGWRDKGHTNIYNVQTVFQAHLLKMIYSFYHVSLHLYDQNMVLIFMHYISNNLHFNWNYFHSM